MSDTPRWTADDMPDQQGRVAIVTGANSGIGYDSALALARKGAHVVLACRDMQKGQAAGAALRQQVPAATIAVQPLDLASLASVRAFAATFQEQHQQLDLLLNNAGVMAPPRSETADGFELQFGTNHLGHFALTGLLLHRLLATPGSRVVTTSSVAHRMGRIAFDDLHSTSSYDPWQAYGQSKLANLLFAFELQRRLSTAGASTLSIAAHPGYSATNLQYSGPGQNKAQFSYAMTRLFNTLLAQNSAMGALPQLYAATAPDAQGGGYYGPHMAGFQGYPKQRQPTRAAQDTAAAVRLWQVSEELTGVRYTALDQRQAA